jgi:hypothetical protein
MRRREVTTVLRYTVRYARYTMSMLAWVGFALTSN